MYSLQKEQKEHFIFCVTKRAIQFAEQTKEQIPHPELLALKEAS